MKILHTITCTRWSHLYGVYVQFQRELTRSRRLSERGIQRMFERGCAEYDADPSVTVCMVQTAVYAR
jgi:hypothetical protein